MAEEEHEEERRYDEAAGEDAKHLDSRVLGEPVRALERKPAVNVASGEVVAEVVQRMVDRKQGCAVVVEDDQVVGIFTERDAVVRVLAAGKDANTTRISEVMSPGPDCLTLDDTLGYALHKMSVGGFRHIPVVDSEGAPKGVISQREGVQYLVGFFPEEILNQPPRSIAQRPPRNQYGG